MKKRNVGDAEYYEGSTNIYADLGYANPEQWSLKASIATKILGIIEEHDLTPERRRDPYSALLKDGFLI